MICICPACSETTKRAVMRVECCDHATYKARPMAHLYHQQYVCPDCGWIIMGSSWSRWVRNGEDPPHCDHKWDEREETFYCDKCKNALVKDLSLIYEFPR